MKPSLPTPPPVLDPAGPEVVLGGADPFNPEIRPTPTQLFGPRSAHLASMDGPLFIADTGHHRVVVHLERPTEDGRAGDLVLGQPDFVTEGRNAGLDDATPETMNVPTGCCRYGDDGLVVADSWNNRVLIWRTMPERSSQPADIVLGQADFVGQRPNRDGDPGPHTMHWPFAVLVHDGRLYVADAGNRRVLVWRDLPTESATPADFALGQKDLTSRSDNGGEGADASTMRWPHDLTVQDGDLVLADAGNNRLLVWDGMPTETHAPAKHVLGQKGFDTTDHNRGQYWPTAEALNMPYAATASDAGILIADTASSRIVAYDAPAKTGDAATRLTGQAHFGTKGDNKNKLPVRDSLCWPYGIQAVGDLVVVADTGNHRIVIWRLAK